jgi:phage terminase large subunit-like protein
MMDFLKIANQYAEDVTNGVIPACNNVKLAVSRSQADHARGGDWPYEFDPKKAVAPCEFISRLKFPTDAISTSAGEPFVLRADQVWHLTEIFGWQRKDNGDRRFRRAFIEIPRGNGKSVEQGAIALYMVATATGGAQVLCTASLKDQARIVFDRAKEMCAQDVKFREAYDLEVKANAICQRHTGNVLKALPATATSVEGTSPNFAVLDELHAVRGRKLFSALLTGCAKKRNSLFICITTAGDDDASVAYEQHKYTEQILNGEATDETYFGLIYTSDEELHWSSPLAWRQANPGIGISVDLHALEADANTAMQLPGEKASFRSRHLNHWISNEIERPFMEERKISKCLYANLKPEAGSTAHEGGDLASSEDLTVIVHAHPRMADGKLHVDAFAKAFLPEATFKESKNAAYENWVQTGELEITARNTTDYKAVEDFILESYFKFDVKSLSFDPLQSNYLITRLQQATANNDFVIAVPQSAKHMTPGMNLLQELVADGRLHTNSTLLIWCLKNLRARRIGSSMIQPVRPNARGLKVDAAIALVMALTRIAANPEEDFPYFPKSLEIDAHGHVHDTTFNRGSGL